MRHGKKLNHLSRTAAHRKSMMANMTCSLIKHKRITTTLPKAKALKKYVEPLITKAKNDTTFIKAVLSIVPAHSLAVERPKSILRPSKKKPDPEGAVIDLLSVIDEYKTAKNQINKDIAHYKELIAEAIQVSVKE